MAKYLSDEWYAECERLGKTMLSRLHGANITIQYVIIGGPQGDVWYFLTMLNGQVESIAAGEAFAPDVTMSMKYEIALKVYMGRLSARRAAMTGRIRPRGDLILLKRITPLLTSPEYQEMQRRIAEITEA
jgi:putative sterol carrier protein